MSSFGSFFITIRRHIGSPPQPLIGPCLSLQMEYGRLWHFSPFIDTTFTVLYCSLAVRIHENEQCCLLLGAHAWPTPRVQLGEGNSALYTVHNHHPDGLLCLYHIPTARANTCHASLPLLLKGTCLSSIVLYTLGSLRDEARITKPEFKVSIKIALGFSNFWVRLN